MRPTFFRHVVHLFFLLVFEGESCWSSPSTVTAVAVASVAGSDDSATGCSLSALAVDVDGDISAMTDVLGSSELADSNRIVY